MDAGNKGHPLMNRDYSYYYGMSPEKVAEKIGDHKLLRLLPWIDRQLPTVLYPYLLGDNNDMFTSSTPPGKLIIE